VNSNLLLEVLVPFVKPGLQIASFDVDDDKRAEIVRISEHPDRFASHLCGDNGHGPSSPLGPTLKQALVSSAGSTATEFRAPVPMLYKTFSAGEVFVGPQRRAVSGRTTRISPQRARSDAEMVAGLEPKHLAEAMKNRTLDRRYWA
jgi:hypothetical protein